MPDVGYRSLEISVVNCTQAVLVVQAANTSDSSLSWIPGEQPQIGSMLPQYQGASWGLTTEDTASSATATVVLSGWGAMPISIQLQNLANGQCQVDVTPNNKLRGVVNELDTGEAMHSEFQIMLEPIPMARRGNST